MSDQILAAAVDHDRKPYLPDFSIVIGCYPIVTYKKTNVMRLQILLRSFNFWFEIRPRPKRFFMSPTVLWAFGPRLTGVSAF